MRSVQSPLRMPAAARKTGYSRPLQRACDGRADPAGTACARRDRPRSAGACAATRGGPTLASPTSTAASRIDSDGHTTGTAGILRRTTGISGSKARPHGGSRERLGGHRRPVVRRVRYTRSRSSKSIPQTVRRLESPGRHLMRGRCRLPVYARAPPSSKKLDPALSRARDDREAALPGDCFQCGRRRALKPYYASVRFAPAATSTTTGNSTSRRNTSVRTSHATPTVTSPTRFHPSGHTSSSSSDRSSSRRAMP